MTTQEAIKIMLDMADHGAGERAQDLEAGWTDDPDELQAQLDAYDHARRLLAPVLAAIA